MSEEQAFVDYYSALQVHPDCDAKILESAYHHLAKTHHPDHTGSDDSTRFNEITTAYRVLRDPEQRAEYDRLYAQMRGDASFDFPSAEDVETEEKVAIDDADDHLRILMFLYKKRRENAQNAGVVGFYIQDMLHCTDDQFEFHKWYLKEKGYIMITEQGTLAITIKGVDHVMSVSRDRKAEKLLISRSEDSRD
jgi:curved DNA-binding protein